MSRRGPIFIGGTGRCGTTLLVRILARHPAIFTLRWESQFLVAPDGLLHVAERRWSRRELERFLDKMRGRWYQRVLNAGKKNQYTAGLCSDLPREDLDAALERLEERVPQAASPEAARALVAEFVDRLFGPAVERAGASRWCEKTPRNLLYADRLAAVFPDLRFIHIVRDGRDVVSSMLEKGFWPIAAGHEFPRMSRYRGPVTLDLAASYWADVLELGAVTTAGLPPGSYLELRFEDLIADPRARLQEVCDFLGEDFSEDLLRQDLSRHHIGRWRLALSHQEAARVEEQIGPMLTAKGYVRS